MSDRVVYLRALDGRAVLWSDDAGLFSLGSSIGNRRLKRPLGDELRIWIEDMAPGNGLPLTGDQVTLDARAALGPRRIQSLVSDGFLVFAWGFDVKVDDRIREGHR